MRSLVIFSVCGVCVMAGVIVSSMDVDSIADELSTGLFEAEMSSQTRVELVLDIDHYDDYDYGFSMAVPAGWRRIVTMAVAGSNESQPGTVTGAQDGLASASSAGSTWMEPGYAVGFESAQQHDDDQFADYILVEILPGESSGLFAADLNHRRSVVIDGRSAWYDRLEIEHASTGLTDVDLVIYQAELAGVGYTVGLYAIGEHTSESIMAIAFELMLQTFRMDRPPFSVS